MKIGIDISQIAYKGTGVARYTENLVRAILAYDTENKYTFFFSSLRLEVGKELEGAIKKKHRLVKAKLPSTFLDMVWNQLHILPIERFIGKQDIFISSDWTQPPSSAKKVTIVHDLVYLRYPETVHKKILAVQKRRLALVKKEVDIILADSQATKDDLIELLTIPKEKIRVLYPACPPLPAASGAGRRAVDIPAFDHSSHRAIEQSSNRNLNYILSVGKLEPRKNIGRLIEAFKLANLKDTELLIVGPSGWGKNSVSSDNIKFLGYVPDEELYKLYSNAKFFIYPSLYEGFGYPVVEAMALGCPVTTSNTSSLKEIGKDAALLFDPKSVETIKDALVTLSNDQKLRENLIQKGRQEAKKYTSEKFAKNLMDILFARTS